MNNMTPMARSPFSPMAPTIVDPRGLETDRIPLVRQYLRIALRWKWVIAGAVIGCILAGLIVTLLMTPQYTATTTIEISRESNQITNIQAVERETGIADQEFYQTQYGLMRARSLAERVAAQLRLADDPEFFEMFGFEPDNPAFTITNNRYPASGRAVRLRQAGKILLGSVDISPTRLSRLVDVNVTTPDQAFSARVANAWAENFIQSSLERRYQATSYARNFLETRLEDLRRRLDVSERQLVAYASNQRIINLPVQGGTGERTVERSIVADDLATLNQALAQATAARIEAQSRVQQGGRSGANAEALRNVAINNLRQRRAELSADYERLMVRFAPEYPEARAIESQITELDQAIRREEARVSGSLQAEYREAVSREDALQTRVDALKSGFLDQRRRAIQYNIFQREVDTNRQLYDGLLQRYKEIGVAGGVGVNNIAVVDTAQVPDRPSSPRMLINLLIATLAGLGLGGLLAFLLEQMDEAIADPTEIERMLGLPLLGSVPKLAEGVVPKEALLDRKSQLVDAYLAVRTNLEFTTEHGVPRSLAVTSTRPAEGKSTTALSLATMLARAGKRVILIDGDMRSPSIHHLGGVSHEHGLSNFLSGSDDIASLVFHMDNLGLTAMTSGPIPPNAAELLTGDRLPLLIERLLDTYEHVVIDSPPVMGLADAPLIGSRVEGVVYAVESHGIRASLVKTALGRLVSANVRVLGGVLTKFEARKAHFGYGYDYGYGYGSDRSNDMKAARGG